MGHKDLAREQVMDLLITLVREATEAQGPVGPKTSFIGDLDIDSLTMVRLDTLIQARLGLALSADDLDQIDTIENLVDALISKGQPVNEV